MSRKRELTFIEKKKIISKQLLREILGTLFYCATAVLIGVVLVIAFGMRIGVVGSSMEPNIYGGQEVLVDRFSLKLLSPKRNDVVCFYPKGNENSHLYVKRVIGLPGEEIQVKDGYVYIDGVRLNESETFDKIADPGDLYVPFKLGENEYFVMGDNRNNSEDSRNGNIGAVSKDTIIGKIWFKLKKDNNKAGFVK